MRVEWRTRRSGVNRELDSDFLLSLPFSSSPSLLHRCMRLGVSRLLIFPLTSRVHPLCVCLFLQAAAQLADPNYKAASREELKRLEEERDAALAGDLFGVESIKPREASSDLPGAGAKAAASSVAAAAASPAPAAAASSSASSAVITPNSLLKAGARLEEAVLDTDADVDRFVADLGRRLEKLGKSALASKKILKLTAGIMDESVKLGLLRLDDVGELKRVVTVKHNDMTAKLKAGGKKKPATAAKPAPALARNAFMHGDVDISNHSDQRADDYDFI